MSRRFFDSQVFVAGQPATLGPVASHHIGKVLRMVPGERLVLFNGDGGEWSATVQKVDKKAVTVIPEHFDPINRSAPLSVTLGLPLIKGDRMDYAIQKAVEMGVTAIHVLTTERTEVRLKGDRENKKMAHWRQVIISASEQCGVNRLPTLDGVGSLDAFFALNVNLKLIAHPGEAPLQSQDLDPGTTVALLTGPEGGFSEHEVARAHRAGFSSFTLGARVLRAETAPVAVLAALWALTG